MGLLPAKKRRREANNTAKDLRMLDDATSIVRHIDAPLAETWYEDTVKHFQRELGNEDTGLHRDADGMMA